MMVSHANKTDHALVFRRLTQHLITLLPVIFRMTAMTRVTKMSFAEEAYFGRAD